MSKPLNTWPLLLCGPILRRVEPAGVSVFVALTYARDVTLTVYDGQTVVANASAPTLPIGKHLHVTVITALPTGAALKPGKIYTYDVKFTPGAGTDPADTDRTVKTLASPGLASPGGLLEGALALGYAPNKRPGFALSPTELDDLRLAHASCRKPHGAGTDALPILDKIIGQSYTSPTERPHQLFLTGDQIYADDVAEPLLEQLIGIAKDLVWDTDEPVPPRNTGGTPPTAAQLAPGIRNLAVKPPLTSGEAHCHLIRFGEFAAMYLFAWSDGLWSDLTLRPLPEPNPMDPGYSNMMMNSVLAYNAQVDSLMRFRKTLGNVRRTLANVPTYMAFDDHEVTDDWYVHREMRDETLASPLGRRIVTNGLSAYTVFQMWGNTPTRFDAGAEGGMFLNNLTQWRGEDSSTAYGTICAAVGTASASSPPHLRFDYDVSGPAHDVIVLDTRTRRAYPGANDDDQPDLLPATEIQTQIVNRIPASAARKTLTVLLSPPPVFGHPQVEWAIDKLTAVQSTSDLDHETWLVSTRRAAFEQLLEALVPLRSVLILSGDVHYAFTFTARYWNERAANVATAAYVQLVSSALKNEAGLAKAVAKLPPAAPELFVGWPNEGIHRRITEFNNWWVGGTPAVARIAPDLLGFEDFGFVDPPKWRYQVGFVADSRLLEDRTGQPRPARAPAATAFERNLAAALEQRSTTRNDRMRCVVALNNVGIVRFATTPPGAASPIILAQHTLWYRLKPDSDGLPYTEHWADLTPPSDDEPPPVTPLSQAAPPPTAAAWQNVISYRPPTAIQTALRQRTPPLLPGRLEKGVGDIRLDWYGVRIAEMPTVAGALLDATTLLRTFRTAIVADATTFLDRGQARYAPYQPQDAPTWATADPTGAVMDHHTKVGNGAVFAFNREFRGTAVVGTATQHSWMFADLKSLDTHCGPVTGNREFGYVTEGTDVVVYTRGAHRMASDFFWDYKTVHAKWADNYLRSMIAALAQYVNSNNGAASVEPRFTAVYEWGKTKAAYHRPTVEWLP